MYICRPGIWLSILCIAMLASGLAGTVAAQTSLSTSSSTSAENSDGSSSEPQAARRSLFKRKPGIKWETDLDPKHEPWSGPTGEPSDSAKERRRFGLLGRLSRGWSGRKSTHAEAANRAADSADSEPASTGAGSRAAGCPAQSTNPARGPGTGRMPKTATAASYRTGQDPSEVPPASASATAIPSAAPLPGGIPLTTQSDD